MGTWGSFGVWDHERQCYRVREVRCDGDVTGLGAWLLKHAPDRETALAVVNSDDDQDGWFVGGPCWKMRARFEFRDGRWWADVDSGIGLTTHADAWKFPLRLMLRLGDIGEHVEWGRRIAALDDQWHERVRCLCGADWVAQAPNGACRCGPCLVAECDSMAGLDWSRVKWRRA